jgi:FG-GAP-like repeat
VEGNANEQDRGHPGAGPAPNPPPPAPPAQAPIPVTITDQASAAGIGGSDWSFSATVADLTGDGWPDLFVSHHWHPANPYSSDGWPDLLICGYTGGLRLFKNNQGQGFTDVSSILGPTVNAVDALMVDVNHDSRPDLIVLTKTAVTLHLQKADGTFAKPRTILKVEDGVALAAGDVNGDNNPDIYVVCGRAGNANAPDYC